MEGRGEEAMTEHVLRWLSATSLIVLVLVAHGTANGRQQHRLLAAILHDRLAYPQCCLVV
jgi:hypothetical protein